MHQVLGSAGYIPAPSVPGARRRQFPPLSARRLLFAVIVTALAVNAIFCSSSACSCIYLSCYVHDFPTCKQHVIHVIIPPARLPLSKSARCHPRNRRESPRSFEFQSHLHCHTPALPNHKAQFRTRVQLLETGRSVWSGCLRI